jgi:hypothetical protein
MRTPMEYHDIVPQSTAPHSRRVLVL